MAVLGLYDWRVDGEVWFEESGNVERLVTDRMVEVKLCYNERKKSLDKSRVSLVLEDDSTGDGERKNNYLGRGLL